MTPKLVASFGLVVSLLLGGQASAVSIPATDLDTWAGGALFAGPLDDLFVVAQPPPATNGSIRNNVYFDGSVYTYTHEVTPSLNNNFSFNSEGQIKGFFEAGGIAGWSFSQAGPAGAGGTGGDMDFEIDEFDGTLIWQIEDIGAGWDNGEPITFFFVSTLKPTIGDFNLSAGDVGTAQSFTPIPEPGSIALLGSGLVGLYAAVRRRRQLKT